MSLKDILHVGKEHAINRGIIMDRLRLRSRREFQKVLETEREEGAIILPDYEGGYYIADPDTEDGRAEIKRYIKRLESMAKSIFRALKSIRRALRDGESNAALKEMERLLLATEDDNGRNKSETT